MSRRDIKMLLTGIFVGLCILFLIATKSNQGNRYQIAAAGSNVTYCFVVDTETGVVKVVHGVDFVRMSQTGISFDKMEKAAFYKN